jgi:hypothetical protein
MEINISEVVAEVSALFDRYEDALVNNKVDLLNALFWNSPTTMRYGLAENLYSHAEIAGFRSGRSPTGLGRERRNQRITTFGRDFAVANTEFVRPSAPGRIGRQSQTWVRQADGWRIVSAHVSWMDVPKP